MSVSKPPRTIPFGRPIIGDEERDAVMEILRGFTLVHGPKTVEFETVFAAWTGAPHAVAVSSCTAAMHLVYFALGYGPGDEVIVPAMSHVATAHAVALTGAKPVFVDAEPVNGNIDISAIEAAITPRTKAIAIVHYLGLPVDMPRVVAIARKHNLFVMEDCALAVGTRQNGVHAGLHGDAGAFSFYPVKHMTTAEGGMIITRDEKLRARLAHLRAFGVDRHHDARSVPGVYDVTDLGFNYRLNEIEAVLGVVQVKRLDWILEQRRRNFSALDKGIRGIPGIGTLGWDKAPGDNSCYCYSIILDKPLVERRGEVIAGLNAAGVGTSVYYPRPIPHMAYYRAQQGWDDSSFPHAARISYGSIALPVGPHLTVEDMDYIADVLRKVMQGISKS